MQLSYQGYPNFFIVGAPKSGTTALSEYLRDHPEVFVSTPKEPFFFCDDFPGLLRPSTTEAYLKLFGAVPDRVRAIGEASTLYLASNTAIKRIRHFDQGARIIAILRNPIEMCQAFHDELRYGLVEDVDDFESAWRLQAARHSGREIPSACRAPALLQYRRIGQLGRQVERLLRTFPRDQVYLVPFDDFVRNTARVYREVTDFLGIQADARTDFPVWNERREHRFHWLARLTQHPPAILSSAASALRTRLGLKRFSFLGLLRVLNADSRPRKPISPAFRAELAADFREDVERLSELIGRDLRHWLE